MKTTVLAAMISTMAIPAFANPGADMFARTLGLQPGEYTMAEMINIKEARRENDDEAERFYLSKGNRKALNFADSVTQGEAQMAHALNLPHGDYSVAEMIAIREARRENDDEAERFYLSGTNRKASNPAEVVTSGEAQLAASLGVDPAQYTLAELARLYADANGSTSD